MDVKQKEIDVPKLFSLYCACDIIEQENQKVGNRIKMDFMTEKIVNIISSHLVRAEKEIQTLHDANKENNPQTEDSVMIEAALMLKEITNEKLDQLRVRKPHDRRCIMHCIFVILEHASEQVRIEDDYVDNPIIAYTDKGRGFHCDYNAHNKYYIRDIINLRINLGLPISIAEINLGMSFEITDEARWSDQKCGKEPIFYNMLEEFMGNDKLQNLLFYIKTKLEPPKKLLAEFSKENACFDLPHLIKSGYTKHETWTKLRWWLDNVGFDSPWLPGERRHDASGKCSSYAK